MGRVPERVSKAGMGIKKRGEVKKRAYEGDGYRGSKRERSGGRRGEHSPSGEGFLGWEVSEEFPEATHAHADPSAPPVLPEVPSRITISPRNIPSVIDPLFS